mmetsp:Transcript_131044/g.261424  ORF Transcript_131044/g.261424 Transcript_131044/m.261424 type:complete len:107 (+) Transcript_131044:346-666(+)
MFSIHLASGVDGAPGTSGYCPHRHNHGETIPLSLRQLYQHVQRTNVLLYGWLRLGHQVAPPDVAPHIEGQSKLHHTQTGTTNDTKNTRSSNNSDFQFQQIPFSLAQ